MDLNNQRPPADREEAIAWAAQCADSPEALRALLIEQL